MVSNVVHNDKELSGLTFTSKYDYDKLKIAVTAHFEKGLLYRTLPGSCGISRRTFYRWLKDKPEFKEFVETQREIGRLQIDIQHLQVAKYGDGNGTCMNKRAECELGLVPHSEQLEEIQQLTKELKEARTKLAEKQTQLSEKQAKLDERQAELDEKEAKLLSHVESS